MDGTPRGEHHQRAGGDQRVAIDERRGAVGRELCRAEPLEERRADRDERQSGERGNAAEGHELQEDHQRRLVDHVLGEDVPRLVREDGLELVVVEERDRLAS